MPFPPQVSTSLRTNDRLIFAFLLACKLLAGENRLDKVCHHLLFIYFVLFSCVFS